MNATVSVLIRRDQSNLPAIFLLDTLNTKAETIEVWSADEQPPRVVPLSYYKNSHPTTDADEEMLISKFRAKFNPPSGVMLRKRLYKENPLTTGKHVVPTTSFVEAPKVAPTRSPTPTATPDSNGKHRLSQQDYDRVVTIERMTNAFAASFAKAMSEAVREVMLQK